MWLRVARGAAPTLSHEDVLEAAKGPQGIAQNWFPISLERPSEGGSGYGFGNQIRRDVSANALAQPFQFHSRRFSNAT